MAFLSALAYLLPFLRQFAKLAVELLEKLKKRLELLIIDVDRYDWLIGQIDMTGLLARSEEHTP